MIVMYWCVNSVVVALVVCELFDMLLFALGVVLVFDLLVFCVSWLFVLQNYWIARYCLLLLSVI